MKKIVLIAITVLFMITSCDESHDLRYKIIQGSKFINGETKISTNLIVWKKHEFMGSYIYENERNVNRDSLSYFMEFEKSSAYNYLVDWIRMNKITDTVCINN